MEKVNQEKKGKKILLFSIFIFLIFSLIISSCVFLNAREKPEDTNKIPEHIKERNPFKSENFTIYNGEHSDAPRNGSQISLESKQPKGRKIFYEPSFKDIRGKLYGNDYVLVEISEDSFLDTSTAIFDIGYISIENYELEENTNATISMYVGTHDVSYWIYKSEDTSASPLEVKNKGNHTHSVKSNSGYITFEVDSFSVYISSMPDIAMPIYEDFTIHLDEYISGSDFDVILIDFENPDNSEDIEIGYDLYGDVDSYHSNSYFTVYYWWESSSEHYFRFESENDDLEEWNFHIMACANYHCYDYDSENIDVTIDNAYPRQKYSLPNYDLGDSGSTTYYLNSYWEKDQFGKARVYYYDDGDGGYGSIERWKDQESWICRNGDVQICMRGTGEGGDIAVKMTSLGEEFEETIQIKVYGHDEYSLDAEGYNFDYSGDDNYDTFTLTSTQEYLDAPFIGTEDAEQITNSSAYLTGNVINMGDYDSFKGFIQYKVSVGGDWQNSTKVSITETGEFSQNITGLQEETEYKFRAMGATLEGSIISYGDEKSFETEEGEAEYPTLLTVGSSDITEDSAIIYANLTSLGDYDSVYSCFELWEIGEEPNLIVASCENLSAPAEYNYTVGSPIINLDLNTTYEFRAVGYFDEYVINGVTKNFTTLGENYPTIVTHYARIISKTSVILNGELENLGNYSWVNVGFEYWEEGYSSSNSSFENITETSNFDYTLNDLTEGINYVFRAVGYFDGLIVYGEVRGFTAGKIEEEEEVTSGFRGIINSLLSLFPDKDDLTGAQKAAFVAVVMILISGGLILITHSQTGGVPNTILYVIGVIDVVLFFFFVTIGYIPLVIPLTIILIAGAIVFFRLKGSGGGN